MEEQIARLIQSFRHLGKKGECEMRISDVTQTNGVSREMFHQIRSRLEQCCLESMSDFSSSGKMQLCDFFFDDNIRTRVKIGFDAISIKKNKLMSVYGVCPQRKNMRFHCSLSEELPIVASQECRLPTWIRMHRCWEFVYKNSFLYCLKQTVSARTKEQAQAQIPHYEVEIEVLPEYLKNSTDAFVAQSLILKSLDLIGRQGPDKLISLEIKLDLTKKRKSEEQVE